LRDFLGGFDFRGDQVTQRVSSFSGGEKARLALALIVWQRPNLLLLDEPTNHLDMDMRESLAQALTDFEGASSWWRTTGTCCRRRPTSGCWWPTASSHPSRATSTTTRNGRGSTRREARGARREMSRPNRKDESADGGGESQAEADARKPFEKKLAAIEAELKDLGRGGESRGGVPRFRRSLRRAQRERMQETTRRRGEIAARIATLEEDWLWIQGQMETELSRLK
jgi:ATP-binding cassette subfamily F protein 3